MHLSIAEQTLSPDIANILGKTALCPFFKVRILPVEVFSPMNYFLRLQLNKRGGGLAIVVFAIKRA